MVLLDAFLRAETSTASNTVVFETGGKAAVEYESREHATTAVLKHERADFKLAVLRRGTHERGGEWSIGRKYRGFDIIIDVGVICEFDCSLVTNHHQVNKHHRSTLFVRTLTRFTVSGVTESP